MRYLPLCLFLTGCSSLPSPETPIPPENAQVRLSALQGAVEGRLVRGAATGSSCVLTVLGKVPEGVTASLKQGECEARVEGHD